MELNQNVTTSQKQFTQTLIPDSFSKNEEPSEFNSSGYKCRSLPFTQKGNSCCAVSLYLCLFIGTNLGESGENTDKRQTKHTPKSLYENTSIFKNSVKYGYLLWKLGVITERTNRIINACVDLQDSITGKYIIQPNMIKHHYMYPSIEEVFLKCLKMVVESGTSEVEIQPRFRNLGIKLPHSINNYATTSVQMVESLVDNCFLLQDVIDIQDNVSSNTVDMVFDALSAEIQKKYNLLNSIFSFCPEQMNLLNKHEQLIMNLYAGNGNPFDFEHVFYSQSDSYLWSMFKCNVPTLIKYDLLIRQETSEWSKEIYSHVRKDFPESLFFHDSTDEYIECGWLLTSLDDYIERTGNDKIRNPTWEQLLPCVFRSMIYIRSLYLGHLKKNPDFRICDPIRLQWGMALPFTPEQMFSRLYEIRKNDEHPIMSFVVTSTGTRSISIHAIPIGDFSNRLYEFIIYDSHMTHTLQSMIYHAQNISGLTNVLKKCLGELRCDVQRICTLPNGLNVLRKKSSELARFFCFYSKNFDIPNEKSSVCQQFPQSKTPDEDTLNLNCNFNNQSNKKMEDVAFIPIGNPSDTAESVDSENMDPVLSNFEEELIQLLNENDDTFITDDSEMTFYLDSEDDEI